MRKLLFIFIIAILIFLIPNKEPAYSWGFFAHQKINRMAVFTLPDEMMGADKKGGVDFTANKTPLEVKSGGEGIQFHIDPAMLAQLQNAPGFVPDIISIEPMTDLRAFLGAP